MLFGDRASFALECELTERVQPFQFCHLRFFILGNVVGDYSAQTTLGVCLYNAEVFLRFREQRLVPDAEKLSASELFSTYYESCFDSRSPNSLSALLEHFNARFHMEEIGGESVREEYAMLLVRQTDERERMVINRKSDWKAGQSSIGEVYHTV